MRDFTRIELEAGDMMHTRLYAPDPPLNHYRLFIALPGGREWSFCAKDKLMLEDFADAIRAGLDALTGDAVTMLGTGTTLLPGEIPDAEHAAKVKAGTDTCMAKIVTLLQPYLES